MKFYSRNNVLLHNQINDCWIIVRNSIYNITEFIASHPGGSDILLSRAGEDATSFFMAKHGRSAGVMNRLEKYKIGELEASDRINANDFDEPFLIELIDKCYKEKLYKVPGRLNNPFFWIRLINISLFFMLSILALYADVPFYVAIVSSIFQAIISTSLFGFLAHEATHRNFPKSKTGRVFLNITWPVFWPFISQGPLRYEHNSHHIKIGDPEFDYEVSAFAPVIRYSGHIETHPKYGSQHKFAKYIYPFYANIITTIGGYSSGFWDRHNRKVGVEHTLSVLATLVYFIVIPSLLQGHWLWFSFLYIIYQCVLFYGIYVGAAINHFVPSVTAPIPEEYKNKYAYYNCHNTTNFCTSSKLWFWYTGGFNIQIEHHLIPFIPVENLNKLIPIVKQLCIKYNYPYKSYLTFKELWDDHYTFLGIFSNNNNVESISAEMENRNSYQGR